MRLRIISFVLLMAASVLMLVPVPLHGQQPQQFSTWPPLNGTPGLVYVSANGPMALAEPVVLGPGVQKPVKAQFSWIINAVPVAPVIAAPLAVEAGWIPLVQIPIVPGDKTERWCDPGVASPALTIDGIPVMRPMNPTAIKEQLQVTTTDTAIGPLGNTVTETYTVVAPGPVKDSAGNEIRITPWWFRSDAQCPGKNAGVALSILPTTVPGIQYKRLQVLVLANW